MIGPGPISLLADDVRVADVKGAGDGVGVADVKGAGDGV
jgi:hypothetical protein